MLRVWGLWGGASSGSRKLSAHGEGVGVGHDVLLAVLLDHVLQQEHARTLYLALEARSVQRRSLGVHHCTVRYQKKKKKKKETSGRVYTEHESNAGQAYAWS